MSAIRRRERWALLRLLQRLRGGFGEGWRTLDIAARRRWLRTVGVGFALLFPLIALVEWAGRALHASGHLAWEVAVLRWIVQVSPLSLSTAVWIQTLGTDITLVMLLALTGGIAAWLRRPLRALGIGASVILLDPVIRVGWALWARARPTLVLDGAISPGFASFPSGHTAKSLALYGILAYIWIAASASVVERAIAALLVAAIMALVALGRLRMGVHWPSDVIAGLFVGGVWLAVLIGALRRAERR